MSLLISGYVVYINAIAGHQSAIQPRDERLRQTEAEHQHATQLAQQSYRALQEKYAVLSRKLEENQQRVPDIRFRLQDGAISGSSSSLHLELPKRPQEPDYDAIIDHHLQEVRRNLTPSAFDTVVILGRGPNPTFEQEAAAYPERYRAYVELLYRFHLTRHCGRLTQMRPSAINRSTVPADDVVIVMHFPDGIGLAMDEEFWFEDDFEYGPQPPSLPQQTKSYLDSINPDISSDIPSIAGPERAIEGPELDDPERPHRVTYRVRRLVPGVVERGFDPLTIWLGDVAQDTS